MELIYKETKAGYEVWPSRRAKLPGIFQNIFQAERAYNKYVALQNEAQKMRDLKKKGAVNA